MALPSLPTLSPAQWLRLRALGTASLALGSVLLAAWGLKRSADRHAPLEQRPVIWTHFSAGPVLWVRADNSPPRPVRLLGLADADPEPWKHWLQTQAAGLKMQIVLDEHYRQPAETPWALVYLEDGRLLNEELLKSGLAAPHPGQRHDLEEWFGRLASRNRPLGAGAILNSP